MEEGVEAALAYFGRHGIDFDTPTWFCIFANYQAEDGAGPSIEAQLQKKPFTGVMAVHSLKCMVTIHTSKADLYNRLWCVHEVDFALVDRIPIGAAMSKEYIENLEQRLGMLLRAGASPDRCLQAVGVRVQTIRATCSCLADEEDLVRGILQRRGGF